MRPFAIIRRFAGRSEGGDGDDRRANNANTTSKRKGTATAAAAGISAASEATAQGGGDRHKTSQDDSNKKGGLWESRRRRRRRLLLLLPQTLRHKFGIHEMSVGSSAADEVAVVGEGGAEEGRRGAAGIEAEVAAPVPLVVGGSVNSGGGDSCSDSGAGGADGPDLKRGSSTKTDAAAAIHNGSSTNRVNGRVTTINDCTDAISCSNITSDIRAIDSNDCGECTDSKPSDSGNIGGRFVPAGIANLHHHPPPPQLAAVHIPRPPLLSPRCWPPVPVTSVAAAAAHDAWEEPSAAEAAEPPGGFIIQPDGVTMTSLSDSDIEKLFSGAPQFFARTESSFPGAPHPSVAFPFDEELEIRDLSDHVQIEDRAWSGVTAWPHLTRDLNRNPAEKKNIEKKTKAHFHIKCRERPNMLSMQGLEKGTMGYQAALELSVGDSLEEEQFGFESVGTKAKVVVEARNRMVLDNGWLKRIPKSEVLDKLKRNGDVYRDNDLRRRPALDTYKEIFHSFMRPSDLVIDKKNHYSLINQINGLVKCLATSNVWIDFSRVEWRIRLGQILWGDQDGDELDDSTSIHDAASAMERAEEKYWLLLQLLVSTELLLRLDAITEGEDCGWSEYFRPMDGAYFEKQANNSVKWSLLLARSWLENIEVVKHEASPKGQLAAQRPNGGWLASMVSSITLKYHGLESEPRFLASRNTYTIRGRNGSRQVDGLTHFARKIQWPGIDAYETRISDSAQNSVRPTPSTLATPSTAATQRTSYFGAWDLTNNHNNRKYHKTQTHRRKTAAALHASGWLSKSYIFALMLPGEAISHFLMATLLENDLEAMSSIGSLANLCGGFVYRNKTFWSTSCIVGRVLAAGQGAAECMGWISTDVVPDDTAEGWLNIEVEDVHEDTMKMGKKARIWGKKRVERESSILGDTNDDKILPADFIIPYENVYATPPPGFDVQLQKFKLLRSVDSVHLAPLSEVTGTPLTESIIPDLPSLPAKMTFLVAVDGQPDEEISFPLTYDISFVTAHPCSPSKRVSFIKSPTSPTIRQIDLSGLGKLGKASRSAHRAGHPLHKYYNYTVIHLTELLQKRHHPLADILKPHADPKLARKNGDNRVLVVDCITSYADTPLSPVLERIDSNSSGHSFERRSYSFDRRRSYESSFDRSGGSPPTKMHLECRRRQFGSDMEIMVRALCASKGWNAIISRRKRGCLACAVREAGALGWKVVIRVD